ncbi:hypothetical protein Hanom_Chr04g00315481 [Helianthus anomalus]
MVSELTQHPVQALIQVAEECLKGMVREGLDHRKSRTSDRHRHHRSRDSHPCRIFHRRCFCHQVLCGYLSTGHQYQAYAFGAYPSINR